MNKDVQKICNLLKHEDHLRRCGAAIVLAELAPSDTAVVKALGEALNGANEQFASCLLEALDAIGSAHATPYVIPMLSSQNPATQMRAASILANGGATVVPLIKKLMDKAPLRQRLIFVDLLARIYSKESMEVLFNMICDPDFNLVKETCEAIRRHIGSATPQQIAKLLAQVEGFLKSTRASGSERITASCLLIMGNMGSEKAVPVLLKYASQKASPYLRKNAMVGLKGVRFSISKASAILQKLVILLSDDESDFVRHTLEVMERLPNYPGSKTVWKKLLKSKASAVKMLAFRKLASGEGVETHRLMIEMLKAEEPELREMSARILSNAPKAMPLLLKELSSTKDPEYAGRVARILKPFAPSADKITIRKFTAIASEAMLNGDPKYDAILYFLRNTGSDAADKVLLETGLKLKQAKKYEQAVECLRKLIHTPLFTDEISYDLSISNLKTSHKELAPAVREQDYALRGLQILLNRDMGNLLDRLQKDKTLDATDLYYIGFHFSEASGSARDFGVTILQHLMKKWPKSPESKAARKKLGITVTAKRSTKTKEKRKA